MKKNITNVKNATDIADTTVIISGGNDKFKALKSKSLAKYTHKCERYNENVNRRVAAGKYVGHDDYLKYNTINKQLIHSADKTELTEPVIMSKMTPSLTKRDRLIIEGNRQSMTLTPNERKIAMILHKDEVVYLRKLETMDEKDVNTEIFKSSYEISRAEKLEDLQETYPEKKKQKITYTDYIITAFGTSVENRNLSVLEKRVIKRKDKVTKTCDKLIEKYKNYRHPITNVYFAKCTITEKTPDNSKEVYSALVPSYFGKTKQVA